LLEFWQRRYSPPVFEGKKRGERKKCPQEEREEGGPAATILTSLSTPAAFECMEKRRRTFEKKREEKKRKRGFVSERSFLTMAHVVSSNDVGREKRGKNFTPGREKRREERILDLFPQYPFSNLVPG